MKDTSIFSRKKVLVERLIPFGFIQNNDCYIYSTPLMDGQFQMTVKIMPDSSVSAKVIDSVSAEEYILHRVSGVVGEFVSRLRREYETLLEDIADKCFEKDIFKSECSQKVISYVRNVYGAELQYLWTRFPDNAVFRRQDNAKWYAAMLVIPENKLDLKGSGLIEIIDLRLEPETIGRLIDHKKYFPGYHMNKRHWFTICLDGSVSAEEIFSWIDNSYILAKK